MKSLTLIVVTKVQLLCTYSPSNSSQKNKFAQHCDNYCQKIVFGESNKWKIYF